MTGVRVGTSLPFGSGSWVTSTVLSPFSSPTSTDARPLRTENSPAGCGPWRSFGSSSQSS